MKRLLNRHARWAFVGLVLSLLACGGGTGDPFVPEPPPSGDTGTISGTITLNAGTPGGGTVLEAEPNDSIDTAHALGDIAAGDVYVVHGHTTALDDSDPFDGFQLHAPDRVKITATLEFPAAGGNDFDMMVYDLTGLQAVEVFYAESEPEVGVFHAKGTFDLIIYAWSGAGDYVLTIQAEAPASPIQEREENDPATSAQYLGDLVPGDTLTLTGLADATSDAADGVLVACPQAVRLDLGLAFPSGGDFDITLQDVTANLESPVFLTTFDSAFDNPETGSWNIPAGTLLHVRVDAYLGGGTWTLTLTGAAPTTLQAATLSGTQEGAADRMAPLALEHRRIRARREGVFFGRPRNAFVPGRVLVGFADDAAAPTAAEEEAALVQTLGARVLKRVPRAFSRVAFDVPEGLDEENGARFTLSRVAALRSAPGVAYAEPDYIYHAFAEPNDEHYNLQWGYKQLRLPEAWDITTGDASVIVAVIDTGRTNHPDLVGRQSGGYDFISDSFNAADGDGMDGDPTDVGDQAGPDGTSSFHGTHVAGTIGAATNNGLGVAGVTWQTQIMHLRVLGRQGGSTSDIASAIRYAARLSNASGQLPTTRADVINMSLGGGGFSQTMQNACTAARDAGVVIFAAAGNSSTSTPSYPAANDGVISISATDYDTHLAPYSNFGTTIDLAAPGGDMSVDRNGDGYADGILSTLQDDSSFPTQAVYDFYQGTSMASPHAAGVAALMLSVAPSLSPAEVESILVSTARDIGAPGRDNSFGHGLIDAFAAVQAARGGATGDPVLSLSPVTLNFQTSLGTLDVTVSNAGGGTLRLGSVTPSTQSGGPWLSASPFGSGNATKDVDGVRIVVDRSGLAVGSYSGRVTVQSDGGARDVQVLMTVGGAGQLPADLPIYVLLLDTSFETVKQIVVNPGTGLDFRFRNLPAGTYYVTAGTDLNDDGYICDEGEYCGSYPVVGQALPIDLQEGEAFTRVDFVVSPDEQIETTGVTSLSGSTPSRCRGISRLK